MKKLLGISLLAVLVVGLLVGCGASNSGSKNDDKKEGGSAAKGEITVVSREEGSGTRGAFVELTKVEKDKKDNTTKEAVIQNKTDAVLVSVAGDKNSVGYISLGSLNDTVKAVKIDGVAPSKETVKDKSYKIARPFNIVTKDGIDPASQDFIKFILSKEGQEVVAKSYIEVESNAPAYVKSDVSGNISVGGSSSVTPIMEKLVEAYGKVNPNVKIQVNQSDSTTGVQSVIDGISQIGMASRELKDSEKSKVKGTVIAMDGIAVIVNKDNSIDNISADSLRQIYTGEVTDWENVK